MISSRLWGLVLGPLIMASLIPIIAPAFAQEAGDFVNRRIEIWALFYKFMVAAFVVGAAVQGTMVYISYKFREGKVKAREVTR